jgi:hypothetical protein
MPETPSKDRYSLKGRGGIKETEKNAMDDGKE